MKKECVHFLDNYLLNPQHPVTINVIGVGGTGSQVLTCLARLDVTLRALDHPGLFVTVYDPDIVSDTNIGRQLFGDSDLELNKAEVLVTRMNHFFGSAWKAVPELYPVNPNISSKEKLANITITCTDNIQSRLQLWDILKHSDKYDTEPYNKPFYWIDFGNAQTSGQVVLGSTRTIRQPKSTKYLTASKLKVITELFNYGDVKEKDSGPSCSLAEALEKQDLFINSTLANLGCALLWKMFREGCIKYQGFYLNLDTLKLNPIQI